MSEMRPQGDDGGRRAESPPAEAGDRTAPPEERAERPGPAEPAEDVTATIAELEDKWRRALADLDNYRKRVGREVERQRSDERARTSAAWLPVLDDLERALEHADAEPGAVIEGVRAVLEQARQIVSRLGYPYRDDTGQPFDPARHEAVGVDPASDAPDGTIVGVVRSGYGEGESQLRPAQVVVAKRSGDGVAS